MEYEFWYNETESGGFAVVDHTNKIEDYGIEIQMRYIDALGGAFQKWKGH